MMKQAVQNLFTTSVDVLDIANDFLAKFQLKHFSIIRFCNEYEYYALTTHPQMTLDYWTKKFYLLNNEQDPHLSLHNEAFLWITQTEHPFYRIIFDHAREYHNLANGVTIPFRHKGYFDICVFASTSSHDYANSLYLNHFEDFKKFYYYFNEKASSIIQRSDQNRIIFPELYQKKTDNKKHKNIVLDSSEVIPYTILTKREQLCLYWVSKGKTSKEIGKILSISSRTVEDHLTNCKIKIHSTSLPNLVYKATKLGLI